MRKRARKGSYNENIILDEEEQEQLLDSLSSENQKHGRWFSNVVAVLCLVPTMVIAALIDTRNLAISLLSITSLVITAFTLRFLPEGSGDSLNGPLARFLPMLNGLLAITITCPLYLRLTTSQSVLELFTSLYALPLFMYVISTIIRTSIASTAQQIASLGNSKYQLKGP